MGTLQIRRPRIAESVAGMLNIFLVPKQNCPHCGKSMNRMGSTDPGAKPVPGSIVMCSVCDGLGVLNDDTTIRKITAEELATLMLDEDAMFTLAQFVRLAEHKRRVERAAKN